MTQAYDRQKRYVENLRATLRAQRGNCCEDCGAALRFDERGKPSLEWSHLQPTTLSGAGRGRCERLLDVKRNPDSYRLRCATCHALADGRSLSTCSEEQYTESATIEIAPIYIDLVSTIEWRSQ